ncbi:family 20 glycosylhydrolase [Sunxiuqinia rutila]|uniref:family 20 glycosylhydrolase n=1 Tax=Sunxiuqinia rutila TaxID=1397841 RepID=UPI003D36DECF
MKKNFLLLIFFLFLFCLKGNTQDVVSLIDKKDAEVEFEARYSSSDLEEAQVKLIPYPEKVSWGKDDVCIQSWRPIFPKEFPQNIVDEFYELSNSRGIEIDWSAKDLVAFEYDVSLLKEAYKLDVTDNLVKVVASTESGFFYALQTLRQLIRASPDEEGKLLPYCSIDDRPAHAVRGFMLDVGRNFQSTSSLKSLIDVMAAYKYNTFHWHLTDYPAWRIESKLYPQLTAAENHRPTRDPGMFYSYVQIRELIRYARKKQIQVIPEIDMPGHSTSFTKAMGFKMESAEGMTALEAILLEFFEEIPQDMAPLIHIGSDEIHINNPEEFINRMVEVVESNNRQAIVWSPGLEAPKSVIRQTWGGAVPPKGANLKEIDSRKSYMNAGEPMSFISTLFFRPLGRGSDNEILGGIICLWPDVNLRFEKDAFSENPFFSGLLTYSWACWTADVKTAPEKYMLVLPQKDTEAFKYFKAFERYLLDHKQRYFQHNPFPYLKQTDKFWKLAGPFDGDEADKAFAGTTQKLDKFLKQKQLNWKLATGNTLVLKQRWLKDGYFPEAEAGQTVYAQTYLYSDRNQEVDTWINFETPLRANRVYSGIPQNGSWDNCGGSLWVNGVELKGPEWENPGWRSSKQTGWGTPDEQEIPWTDEELYWLRKPAKVNLKQGWNRIVVKIPYKTDFQNWMFTFIPLEMKGLQFSPDQLKEFEN